MVVREGPAARRPRPRLELERPPSVVASAGVSEVAGDAFGCPSDLVSDFAAPGSLGGTGDGPPITVFGAGFADDGEADAIGGGTLGEAPEMTRGSDG